MNKNLRRRLTLHEQRNRLSVGIALIIVIGIYLTITSIRKVENSSTNSSKVYSCPKLTSSPKGYFRVDFADNFPVNYSSICKSTDLIHVYILSTAQNFLRRQAIRQTWANKSEYEHLDIICFAFIVGLSTSGSPPGLPFNGDIIKEAAFHKDMVQLNLKETYEHVAYKEVGALKWSYIYASHIPYLFKTDDDLIIDTLLLSDITKFLVKNRTDHSLYIEKHKIMQDFVQQMHKIDKYTLFKGYFLGGIPTLRSGKFGVHEFAWNHEKLPAYCSGFGFIYSSFIRDRLYRASLCYATEYVPLVGDVFVSGFLAGAASVRCSPWPPMYIQTFEPCSPHFLKHPDLLVCSTPMHGGQQRFDEFNIVWQVILGRHPTTANRTTTTIATTPITTTMIHTSSLSTVHLIESVKNVSSIIPNVTNETKEIIKRNPENIK